MKYLTQDLILTTEVARGCGCTSDAVVKMIRRHKRPVYKLGRFNALHFADARWLIEHRERRCVCVAKRPKGWLGSKQVTALLDVGVNKLPQLHRRGELVAVRVGKTYFYEPKSVEACRQRHAKPAVGWVPLSNIPNPRSYPSVMYRVVARLGLETRNFHASGIGRGRRIGGMCIRDTDVAALVAVLNRPESYPDRLMIPQLARLAGTTRQAVTFWLTKGLPSVKDRQGRVWLDLQQTLTWLESRRDSRYAPYRTQIRAALTKRAKKQARAAAEQIQQEAA